MVNNPKLFDAVIRPILIYGSEVWSQQFSKKYHEQQLDNNDSIIYENLHKQVCKHILGVRKFTSNPGSRTELGRIPLSVQIIK